MMFYEYSPCDPYTMRALQETNEVTPKTCLPIDHQVGNVRGVIVITVNYLFCNIAQES